MATQEDILKKIRDELGIVQSSALLMAHAQTLDARLRYLKNLGNKVNSISSLLEKLQASSSAAAAPK